MLENASKNEDDQIKSHNKNQFKNQEQKSFASSIRKSLINQSIRKFKKRKSILSDTSQKNSLDFMEEDGALSTQTGDLAILLEFDLDSNFKFIPYRTELNNLIANNLVKNNHNSMNSLVCSSVSSLYSQDSKLTKIRSNFIDQFVEHLPELILQRIAFCNEHSDMWRMQIKLAHDIAPKPFMQQCKNLNEQFEHSNVKRSNSVAKSNNNDFKRICLCNKCQFKQLNGSKYQDCKMPSMDNILLRANEFELNPVEKRSNFKISQLFNR